VQANLLFGKSALAHVRLPKERTLPKFGDIYGEQVSGLSITQAYEPRPYSHSIVPGGLLVTSYTTRLTPFTSLMIRVATLPMKPMSKG
jgi:hypothetical protein